MRPRLGTLLPGVTVFLLVTAPAWAAPERSGGKRSELPPAVAKTVEENKPGAEIDKLTVEDEAGIKLYDIEFKAGGGEIEVAEDGTVLDVATVVEMKEVPAAAAAAIRKAAAGGALGQIERSEVRAKIERTGGKGRLVRLAAPEHVYEAELAKGGEVQVAADGRRITDPQTEGKDRANEK